MDNIFISKKTLWPANVFKSTSIFGWLRCESVASNRFTFTYHSLIPAASPLITFYSAGLRELLPPEHGDSVGFQNAVGA